jgi:hypothetical protein
LVLFGWIRDLPHPRFAASAICRIRDLPHPRFAASAICCIRDLLRLQAARLVMVMVVLKVKRLMFVA